VRNKENHVVSLAYLSIESDKNIAAISVHAGDAHTEVRLWFFVAFAI
jgi:hypothetical protein